MVLRILFISHAYVVGVNQGKLEALAQTGKVEIGLLAPSNWKSLEWNRLLPLETPYSKIKTYSLPVTFPGRGGAYIFPPQQIWQILQNFQPDIVQVEEEVFSLCAFEIAIWSQFKRKPLVIFGWENMDRSLPLPRHLIRKFVMNTAKLIIAGNQDGGDLLRKWGYTGLIEIMPQMGVDNQLFTPNLDFSKPKNKQFRIGFLGRLVPEKGIDTIFAAVNQLQQQEFKCHIILCGSGTSQAVLKQEAERQQISNLITWRQGIPHHKAPEEISQFDVLVLPSRTTPTWKEQFGHVLIEAMAMGIPVIGSDSGEIPNVIGRRDLIFPEADASALAAIIKRMICDSKWYKQISQYGITRVQEHYTHERIAERLIKLWQQVAEVGEVNTSNK